MRIFCAPHRVPSAHPCVSRAPRRPVPAPALLALSGVVALAIAFQLRRAVLAARAEYRALSPRRGPVARPADASLPDVRDVAWRGGDGGSIRGWYAPPHGTPRGPAIVFLHGTGGDRTALLPEARALAAAGYGVLLYDGPGHGESGGRLEYGAAERAALAGALDFLARRPEVDGARLGAVGYSLGGYVATLVAADDARLRAVVLVGTPADLRAQVDFEYRDGGPAARWGARLGQRLGGLALPAEQPVDVAARLAPRRVLVVHGGADRTVDPADARALHAAVGPSATLWLVPGAGHAGFAEAAPDYLARLRAFLDDALRPLPAADLPPSR